jgi:hypothetical protein
MTKESFDAWHGQEIFLFFKAFRLAFGAFSKPPIQLEPWAASAEVKWLGMKISTHLCVVLRLRMSVLHMHFPIHAFMV